jgi:hypothetical protein
MAKGDKPTRTGKTDKTAHKKPGVEIAISDEELDKASGGACSSKSAEAVGRLTRDDEPTTTVPRTNR